MYHVILCYERPYCNEAQLYKQTFRNAWEYHAVRNNKLFKKCFLSAFCFTVVCVFLVENNNKNLALLTFDEKIYFRFYKYTINTDLHQLYTVFTIDIYKMQMHTQYTDQTPHIDAWSQTIVHRSDWYFVIFQPYFVTLNHLPKGHNDINPKDNNCVNFNRLFLVYFPWRLMHDKSALIKIKPLFMNMNLW